MKIIEEIKTIISRLESYDYDKLDAEDGLVTKDITKLENIARDESTEYEVIKHLSEEVRKLYAEWEFAVERKNAKEIIEDEKNSFWDNPQLARTYQYAREEGTAAGVDSNSKMLFVGSGWVPESALAHANVHGCKVVCVDQNIEAVETSRELIKKLGLENKIKVLHANGEGLDYSDYTHIAVAIMALPKKEILKRIRVSARDDVKIICRTVKKAKRLIYTPTEGADMDGFKIINDIIAADKTTIISSVILAKN